MNSIFHGNQKTARDTRILVVIIFFAFYAGTIFRGRVWEKLSEPVKPQTVNAMEREAVDATPSPSSSPIPTPKPAPRTPYDSIIEREFGSQAENAKRVLRYKDKDGYWHGENVHFQLGPEVDISNSNGSIDRGLYRINSYTFAHYLRVNPEGLEQLGITSYKDMYDPELNIKMARVIYKYQGWCAWYAAPADLRKDCN